MVDVVTIPPRFQEHQAVARTCRRRRRLQNQLSAPRANVTETTASSPQCIRVTSTALNSSASAAKSTPAGKRKCAACGCFLLSTGSAAAIEPYMNIRATAESIAFHRKLPAAENKVSSTAKATMEI